MVSKYIFVYFLFYVPIFGHCDKTYNFVVRFIHQFFWMNQRMALFPPEIFPISEEGGEPGAICLAAKEYAALDVEDPAEDGTVKYTWDSPGLMLYTPEEARGKDDVHACKTEPRIWLTKDDYRANRMVIMMLEDEANASLDVEKYTFHVGKIHSPPTSLSSKDPDYKSLMEQDNSLQAGVGARAWGYICEKAQNLIEFEKVETKMIKIFERQLLEFTFPGDAAKKEKGDRVDKREQDSLDKKEPDGSDGNRPKEKHVSLICPTRPIIYAYFGTSKYDVKMKVLVEEGEALLDKLSAQALYNLKGKNIVG